MDLLTFSIKLKQKKQFGLERKKKPSSTWRRRPRVEIGQASTSTHASVRLHTLNSLLLCSAHVRGDSVSVPLGGRCQAESTSGRGDRCAALTPEALNTLTSQQRPTPACQNAPQQLTGPVRCCVGACEFRDVCLCVSSQNKSSQGRLSVRWRPDGGMGGGMERRMRAVGGGNGQS